MTGVKEEAPLRHGGSSLSEQVFETLEAEILNGKRAPGESLIELKISAELGVSRTPVREALRMLEQKGLVEAIPNKGAVVLGISRKDLADVYEIRTYVEGLAARWAAEHCTEADLQELQEMVALQRFYCQRGSDNRMNDLDSQFHEKIYAISNSRPLRHVLSELHHMISRFRRRAFASPERSVRAIEEHQRILEAMEARDSARAEALMAEHVKNARDYILQTQEI